MRKISGRTVNVVLNSFHLFAGAGGGILADQLLGHRVIGAVEIEAYPRKVLLARQLDGCLPQFPIWDDVTTFRHDNPDCAGYIDRLREISGSLVICGGFPCQDISAAGKCAGIAGERSGIWKEFARIIGEVRPAYVFVENSPMLVIRGLGTVIGDISSLGYDAEWCCLSAGDCGALHIRDRFWMLARQRNIFSHAEYNRVGRRQQRPEGVKEKEIYANSYQARLSLIYEIRNSGQKTAGIKKGSEFKRIHTEGRTKQWPPEPEICRVVNGMAGRVDRISSLGNGQVPRVAATAFNLLMERLNKGG